MSESSKSTNAPLSRTGIGRMTGGLSRLFGGTSTFQATSKFLRRQLWAWPIVAALLFGGVGWWVHSTVENAMRKNRVNALTAILEADVAAVRTWIRDQENIAELIARDEQLLPMVRELLTLAPGDDLVKAKAQRALRLRLQKSLKDGGYVGFYVVSHGGVVLASDQDVTLGKEVTGYRREFFDGLITANKPAVSLPFRSTLLLADEKGELRANLPTMFAGAPLLDDKGKPFAALGLRIRPDDEFTRILQTARIGETGETYAFDRRGMLLSQSRFDDDLKQIGLLADLPESQSILTVELRDPGINMVEGARPSVRRTEQPLTHMAQFAVEGRDGYDVNGYRDYRGVPVIGAWQWLDEFGFGIATEIDVAEAFEPLYILRRAFWSLMVLLVLCAIGIFIAMLYMARQQCELQKATLAAKQLGQYSLEEKIGSGGMGTVYRARHAMLRRPTAVKLLDVDKVSEAATARFEREVQLTSSLTHPNTVAIYDYGRTPDGIFYYAMELLEGMDLEDLVTRHGILSEARAVFLLRQICGSLAEAHARGLVHRDIKPANIFLTSRGGLHDFVKVLDFGLVKALENRDTGVTAANAVTGTPLYLSPEAINEPDHVDARADVYAIGAVGYYLLTGTSVFTGTTVMEICMKQVQAIPEPPSLRRGKAVSPALEAIILRCLAKPRLERPSDAAELLRVLETCDVEGRWTSSDAATWWTSTRLTTAPPTVVGATAEFALARDMPTAGETTSFEKR